MVTPLKFIKAVLPQQVIQCMWQPVQGTGFSDFMIIQVQSEKVMI